MTARRYAVIAASLYAFVTVFQIAVAAGAPWGAYTQGGQSTGVLPSSMRLVAGSSALIVAAMGLTVLAAVDLGPLRTANARSRLWAMRGTTAYAGVAVVANLATRSAHERAVWAPISTVLLVCCLRVLRTMRRA